MVTDSNQLKLGTVISYVQMAFSIIIGLIYTPVMIQLLGKSEYGLYNLASSTISMLSILSLGFNSGYIRYFAAYKKRKDEDAIAKLNGLYLIIFTAIGVIALLCGLYLSFHLSLVFDQGLTAEEYKTAQILMILLTLNLAVSFPMSVFQSIISAHERFVFLKGLVAIKTVVSPLITLPILLMGYRSIAMVSVTVGISLIVDIAYVIYVKRVLRNRFEFHHVDFGLLKDLFVYTSFIAINIIVDQINTNIDNVLLGRFCGTASVAIYAVGHNLHTYYKTFSTSISGIFTPKIHKIVNRYQDREAVMSAELTRLFTKVGRIQFLILALLASGLCFFGKPFIHFWAGDGYENAYYVALLLILPSTIPLIQNLGIEIQRAENKHQFRSIVYFVMALINLISSIFLCQKYGEIGATIGTAASVILANGLIMNIYYHKECGINIIFFWKNILRQSVGLILPVLSGFIITRTFLLDKISSLLCGILIYTVIYCVSMWFFGMNQFEKSLVTGPVKKIVSRISRK